jgi:hypothetical protein
MVKEEEVEKKNIYKKYLVDLDKFCSSADLNVLLFLNQTKFDLMLKLYIIVDLLGHLVDIARRFLFR